MQEASSKVRFRSLFLLSFAQVWWFVDDKAPADMNIHLDNSNVNIEANQQFTCTIQNGSWTVTITHGGRAVADSDDVVFVSNDQAHKGGESAAASSSHGPSLSSSLNASAAASSSHGPTVSLPLNASTAASSSHEPTVSLPLNTSAAPRQHANTPDSTSRSSVLPSVPCDNEPPGGILGQVNQPEVPTGATVDTGTASYTAASTQTTVDQAFDKLAEEASHHSGSRLQSLTHAPAVRILEPLSTPPSCNRHAQGNHPAEVNNFQRWYLGVYRRKLYDHQRIITCFLSRKSLSCKRVVN